MVSQKGRPATNGPRCGANTAHGPCRNPAGKGTNHLGYGHCLRHGGKTPTGEKHGARLMAEDQAALAARQFGIEVETNAQDALVMALTRSLGTVLFYRAKVQALSDDQMVYGTERITRTIRPVVNGQPGGPTHTIEDTTVARTAVSVWLRLLQEAEAHHLKVAVAVAGLGIEQRRLRIAEEQGARVAAAMVKLVTRMGISPDDPRLPVVVGEVIEELTAG